MVLAVFLHVFLLSLMTVSCALAWSNGGYSADPSNPDYGTHDWIAQHALDWLPSNEKQYILDNLAVYLYGTELPDNNVAPDGIGDVIKHHVYYDSSEVMIDDVAAARASTEYAHALNFANARDYVNASKRAGVMSHYIADLAVFGHVMGAGTEWGAEVHHSDYETYVNDRTSSYTAEFNSYLSFDGSLTVTSAYEAAKNLAYDTTFDVDGDLTCVWMDNNYNWSNTSFRDRAGESLNLAVNYIADVMHTLFLESHPETMPINVPRDYATVQQAIDSANSGSTIHVEHGTYSPLVVNKSLTIIGESVDNTIIDGKGTQNAIRITADNVFIRGLKVRNANNGIEISNSNHVVIASNMIMSNDRGISLSNSNEITIASNTIKDNNYGIALDLSYRNTITRNTASNNIHGIDLRYSQNNTISWNIFASNTYNGLLLYHGTQNIIMSNSLKSNGQYGIYMQHCLANILYHNNIINNTNQIYQYDSSNTWFSRYERFGSAQEEGNYWSDYAGLDTDGDGVGETSLPHQGVDNYPLMAPSSSYPVANFSHDPPVQMANKAVTFDASASFDEDGTIKSFIWNFGDGNITVTTNETIAHKYAGFGNYTAVLMVTDNEMLSDSCQASLAVIDAPSARITFHPQSPLIDETVTFNASASAPNGGSIASCVWSFGDAQTGTGMITDHSYTDAGYFTVTLMVLDSEGLNDTVSLTLRVYAKPVAFFTYAPSRPSISSTVTFNASTSYDKDGTIASYLWNFGDGNTTTINNKMITHQYTAFGNFVVTLTVIDNDALTAVFTDNLVVYTYPTAVFTYSPEAPLVGQMVTFNASLSTANTGTIASYSWDFETDGIADANGMIVDHTFSSQGIFTTTLIITNDGGLSHTKAINLTVTAAAAPGIFGWLQSPAGTAALLVGTAVIAIGVPIMILKRRNPPAPVLVPPKASPPSPPAVSLPSQPKPEKGPKAVITVSKTNGEYTVMVEGPEDYPVKLKHQFKVDDKVKLDLIRDFDTTALIANYWRMSRSGTPVKEPPKVQTLDITAHLERSGRLMYRYLTPLNIGRFFKTVRIDHLWLEIDESLLEIPWELMHDGDDFICLKYAVGRRILTGQVYEAKPPRILKKPHFLLVGDPSEELPDAKKEIQLLAKHLEKLPNVEVTALSGSEITKLDFLQMLSEGKYDCIHFAGHAGFNVERPDESYLKFNDALCYAYETKRLVNEENPPEIVFVNACSSAKEAGQTAYEKEIGGLAKAFLFKGSMGYIGALWPVHDEAVARLSVSFYTKLVSGVSVGEALRQARRESYLEHKGKEIAWASFTLYGDPNLKLF